MTSKLKLLSASSGFGLMLAFAIAGAICIVAALCYAEIASMLPVAGSAYTYTYTVMGELLAWTVGWALVLEYAVAASAVSVLFAVMVILLRVNQVIAGLALVFFAISGLWMYARMWAERSRRRAKDRWFWK